MGDRALIVFHDGGDVSPVIYLHWNGHDVPEMLKKHKALMSTRGDDLAYAAARFIGIAHEAIPGNLSLGVSNAEPEEKAAVLSGDAKALDEISHGDAGLIVVDTRDYSWKAYGGYLEKKSAA